MPHPSEVMLLAFADDELGPADRAQVSAHVQGCGVCRHALRDVRDAMAAVRVEAAIIDASEPASWRDAAEPPVRPARPPSAGPWPLTSVGDVLPADRSARTAHSHAAKGVARRGPSRAKVASGDGAASGLAAWWGARAPRATALRWAAILLVFAAGGATAMLAPRWRALLGLQAPEGTLPSATSPAPDAGTAPAAMRTAAAVSVLPRDGSATVVLQPGPSDPSAASPAVLVVTVSERADVQVTVSMPLAADAAPRFRTADGRLDVALAGNESRVEVEVPSTLGEAHIVFGTRTLVTVRGGVVTPQLASTTGVPLSVER